MRKLVRIGFPIVCIGVIGVTFGMLNDIKKKAEITKEKNEKQEENIVNVVENDIENSVENNTEESFFGTESDVNMSKAMYIFREQIEIDEELYYLTSEGEEKGRYIIAVRDNETTEAEQYYIVDIESQEIEIYY